MSENIKIFVGLLVPGAAVAALFFAVFSENYILGIFLSIFGIASWLIYTIIVKSYWPQITGNIIIVFGALLALSVFLDVGLEQNIFGGLNVQSEGLAYSTILLFFSVLLGVLFKKTTPMVSASITQKRSHAPVAAPATIDSVSEKKEDNSDMSDYYMEHDPGAVDYGDEYFPGYGEYFQEDYEE